MNLGIVGAVKDTFFGSFTAEEKKAMFVGTVEMGHHSAGMQLVFEIQPPKDAAP